MFINTRLLAARAVLALVLSMVAGVGPTGAQESLVTVYGRTEANGVVTILVDSAHIIPVYVRVDAPQLTGMSTATTLPTGARVEPGTVGQELFQLAPTRQSGRVGYSLSYSFARGDPTAARHDDAHRYLFPFAHGSKYRLSQGFHGAFSHSEENEFAVDFEMPVGTPIHAARDGLVVEVKQDSRRGGASLAYGPDANFILIAHDDGSFANYAHLEFGGSLVSPGDRVTAGRHIGSSGNTGRSTGPHLHFDIRLPTLDGGMQSIPFLFHGLSGSLVPNEGAYYYAHHPGGPPFAEVLGDTLTLGDLADHRERVPATRRVEIRVEQIDMTFVLFIRNGLDREVDVDLTLELSGLTSDVGSPVRQTVAPRTEVAATILRRVPGATRMQYGYSVGYR